MRNHCQILRAWAIIGAIGLVILGMVGCSSSGPQALNINPTQGAGSLTFTIQWPDTRVIPVNTQKIVITLAGQGLSAAQQGPFEFAKPASGGTVTKTVTDLPVVDVTVKAQAFDINNILLAEDTKIARVVNNAKTTVALTMQPVQADVEQSIAAAVALLVEAKDLSDPNAVKLKADDALALLNQALASAVPGSQGAYKAHFYWVLAKLESAGSAAAAEWSVTLQSMQAGPALWLAPEPVGAVSMAMQATDLTRTTDMVRTETFLDTLLPFRRLAGTDPAQTEPFDSAKYQKAVNTIKNTLLPAFTAVDQHLAELDQPNLAVTLQPPQGTIGTAVIIDQGDIQLLRAIDLLVVGILNHTIAYNFDFGDFTYFPDLYKYDLTENGGNNDGKIVPSEYFPPAPFGTLATGGATNMTAALAAYQTSLAKLESGATFHLQPGKLQATGELLNGMDPNVLSAVRDVARYLQSPFAGPYTVSPWITGLNQDLTMNLPAAFNNPVQDLRSIAPIMDIVTIQDGLDTRYDVVEDLTTIENKTLNGLFPNGLPSEVLYDTWNPDDLFGGLNVNVN
jgi:hypothetical protein